VQTIVTILLLPIIVVVFASLVLVARSRLVASGKVSLSMNDGRTLEVEAGDKLLWTLAEQGVFLPSPCGGRGSCGQCRLRVHRGGGQPLSIETSQLSRKDVRDGCRLACQVTVREDLSVSLPVALLSARHWRCRVRSNRNVSTFLTELVLDVEDADAFSFDAGAYAMLEAPAGESRFTNFTIEPEYLEAWRQANLLDLSVDRPEATSRAYSLANPPSEHGTATMVIRIALPPVGAPAGTPPGQVSSYAFDLKPGDIAEISGPYGEFRARETSREMVFIGGGAGIGPLRSIILDQLLNRTTKRRISFFYGARSRRDLCYVDEFDRLAAEHDNFSWQVALSDAAPDELGDAVAGFVHSVAYSQYLSSHPKPEACEYYLCGPPLMSRAVIAMLEDLGVEQKQIFLDDFGS